MQKKPRNGVNKKKAQNEKEILGNLERYDKNLGDSDDSSDEEVLLRTGNVP